MNRYSLRPRIRIDVVDAHSHDEPQAESCVIELRDIVLPLAHFTLDVSVVLRGVDLELRDEVVRIERGRVGQ